MPPKKSAVQPELGTTGLRRTGGWILEGFPKNMQGPRAMKFYGEIADTAIAGAGLTAINKLAQQVSWSVKPFSDDQADRERAEFVETCLHDMSYTWPQTLEEFLSMIEYGCAPCEIVYKRRDGDLNDPTRRSRYSDGRIGWRKLPLRAQETVTEWKLDDAGGIQGLVQVAAPRYASVPIPIERLLLFRASSRKNNPWGRSALYNAQWPHYASKKLMEVEGIAIERDMTGLPVMEIPATCFDATPSPNDAATLAAAKDILKNVRMDEEMGLALPLSYDDGGRPRFKFSLMASPGKRTIDVGKVVERYERRILMVLLADFILMGHENVGSFALSSDKTALFAVALGGWLDAVAQVVNVYGIPRLMAANGWPTDRCPTLCHGDIEVPNLGALGEYIARLYQSGFDWSSDPGIDAHLRKIAGLPKALVDGRLVQLYGPDGKLLTYEQRKGQASGSPPAKTESSEGGETKEAA